MGKQVDAIAVGSVGVGLVFVWSGLRGASVIATMQEIIQGKRPTFAPTRSIDVAPVGDVAGSIAGAAAQAVSGAGWATCRASSYWGSKTASGRSMTGTTIASPYLPLGTVVEIAHKGKQVTGTVWDFGPADWVMLTDPTRFLDLAEPLMASLTGTKSNTLGVQYKVTAYGTGRIYRPNHSMTAKLRAQWKG